MTGELLPGGTNRPRRAASPAPADGSTTEVMRVHRAPANACMARYRHRSRRTCTRVAEKAVAGVADSSGPAAATGAEVGKMVVVETTATAQRLLLLLGLPCSSRTWGCQASWRRRR